MAYNLKQIQNKLLTIQLYIAVCLNSTTLSRANNLASKANISDYTPLVKMLNHYAQLFSVFIVVMALASFVYNIISLGIYGNNPQRRADAVRNICISGAVAAFLPLTGLMLNMLMGLK